MVENEGGFFVGEGGRPPNPRRGTNRKGRSCAGGDGVGAVERNSEGMGGVRVFSGGVGAVGVREREGGDGIWW